jgi:hypothetical protein
LIACEQRQGRERSDPGQGGEQLDR